MESSESKSRLLLVTPDFPPNCGGIASYLGAMSRYFGGRMQVKDVDLLYKHFWPKWLRTTQFLRNQVNGYDIVVISHVLPFGTAAYFAKFFTKKPFVIIVHGLDIRLATKTFWRKWLVGIVLRSAYLVISNSNALAQELSIFGVHQALVVYPCLETIADEIDINKTKKRILTVSRLVERKGHERVLRALAELRQIGRLENVEYHIVGSGPYEQQIRSTTHSLNLDSVVFFHGDVDDRERTEMYQQSDLFVMPVLNDPIDKEGFGLVYIEAASHGLPSIATDISGVDEAVIHGETGILVKDNDIPELATWIDRLLRNKDERDQLGNAARERAQSEFTCEHQFAKLDQYL